MKCDYCGGNLSLEDERCPHCGQINTHAKKHVDDMKHYQGEFESTQKYVKEKTATYTEFISRGIFLAILAIVTIVIFVLCANIWEIRWSIKRSTAERNFQKNSAIIEQYLEEEDYIGCAAFVDNKAIRIYGGVYDEYRCYIQACNQYRNVMDMLQRYAMPSPYENTESMCKLTGDCLEDFYKYYKNEEFRYTGGSNETEKYREIVENMNRTINATLTCYCGFTEEEAEAFKDMSLANRYLMIEEKLNFRLSQEEVENEE